MFKIYSSPWLVLYRLVIYYYDYWWNDMSTKLYLYSEWVSECWLTPYEKCFTYTMERKVTSTQHSAVRYVTPFVHIIMIPSQPVFVLTPSCCVFSWEAVNTNLIVFGHDRGSNTRSTSLDMSLLINTLPMRFLHNGRWTDMFMARTQNELTCSRLELKLIMLIFVIFIDTK